MSKKLGNVSLIIIFSIVSCVNCIEGMENSYIFSPSFSSKLINFSEFTSRWDTSNIPEEIIMRSQNLEEAIETLATRKYKSCRASVLFHPLKNLYYFRNPSIQKMGRGTGSLKEYSALRCRAINSRPSSDRQRFFIPFKDIEQLLDNNEDSILLEGIHEISDLRNGLEMSLFPVKFYKALPLNLYNEFKELLCYDSIKVLGIDKQNFDYFILSAMDRHKILLCDSQDISQMHNFNNFIRYSTYCDEFCAEDFIYFSNDLIKCKCDFFSYVDDLKKNINFKNKNNDTEGCLYARRVDRYELFANPSEIAEKLMKYEEHNKSYHRYYLHLIILTFTFQILYAFYFTNKNSIFLKFTVIFYIILTMIVYVPHRLRIAYLDIIKIFEVITDLYPVVLLVFLSCDSNSKQYDILKLSLMIIINSGDYILKEIRINEFELVVKIVFIICSFLLSNTLDNFSFLQFFNLNLRVKNIFELLSRFFLYCAGNNIMSDFSVPLFVLLGRPREAFIYTDHLLFQSNYLKLKPSFDKLYENWFMEALNFHKIKNMIIFLKFSRYFLILLILSFLNISSEMNKILTHLFELNFNKVTNAFLGLAYINGLKTNYSNSQCLNKLHIGIMFSFLFTNIFITKDSFKVYFIHFVIGAISILLCEETINNNNNQIIRDNHNGHRNGI
jgi:hypothetical protein